MSNVNIVKTGFFVVGELLGVQDKPWKGSASGSDHLLGISIFRPDSWGRDSENVFSIKVYSDEIKRVDEFCSQNIGKLVSVQFSLIYRKSKDGSKKWVEYAITSDCTLSVLS